MTITTVPVYDATHANISRLPQGQAAGYSTGSGVVPWTAADWDAHPGAVRIAQSPFEPADNAVHADVLDVETEAATVADVPGWAEAAAVNFFSGVRPGQRHPAVYVNLSNLTPVVNALAAAKITSGVSLWIANWNLTEAEAAALVTMASGPYPVVGCQYRNAGLYDISVFSAAWLDAVSGDPLPPVSWSPVTVSLPTLRTGMTDVTLPAWYIRRAQAILRDVYGAQIAVDGVYGAKTADAIKMLVQARYGLVQDSVIGKDTWTKLIGG